MTFNSSSFVLFMLVVLLIRYSAASWTFRKSFLLGMSYLFYAAWNPPFLALVLLSTGVDWVCARNIAATGDKNIRRAFLWGSLCFNLGLLAWFKYADFFVLSTSRLLGMAGIEWQPVLPDILLPVGISFYTFQTISYTIDVYRRRIEPADSMLDYALYVTFFPQLVAGPIVRAKHFLSQCKAPVPYRSEVFGYGLFLMLVGMFEKIVLADGYFSPVVEAVYSEFSGVGFRDAWVGTLAFAGQIFCDFAGYSTCAIGCAKCLGFELPINFRSPYAARGFSDFWKRWHISLSEWLRDYLYIPLGGSRHGVPRMIGALVLTMFLGGLWHGAGLTFIVWGLLHGAFLVGEHLARNLVGDRAWLRSAVMQWSLQVFTFLLVCITWVFFRAETIGQAGVFLEGMFGTVGWLSHNTLLNTEECLLTVGVVVALLATHHVLRNHEFSGAVSKLQWPVRSVLIALMVVGIAVTPVNNNAFIYFQF